MENYELTEALKEKLETAENLEEMVAAFAAEGIEVTEEQLEALADGNTELDEDALDEVSGGSVLRWGGFIRIHVVFVTRVVRKVIRRR